MRVVLEHARLHGGRSPTEQAFGEEEISHQNYHFVLFPGDVEFDRFDADTLFDIAVQASIRLVAPEQDPAQVVQDDALVLLPPGIYLAPSASESSSGVLPRCRVSEETRGPSTLLTRRVEPSASTMSPGSGGRPRAPRT